MATNTSSAPGGPTPSCSTKLIGAPSGRDGAPWDSALQVLDLDAWHDIDRSCDPRGCNDAFAGRRSASAFPAEPRCGEIIELEILTYHLLDVQARTCPESGWVTA